MKQLFYPPPIRQLMMVLMLLIAGNSFLFAEGSVDFRNYPGNRLFYNVEQNQQLKVYANAGESINVGSSHVGINGGTIEVYDPNGNLVQTFDGAGDRAIIFNDVQELAGPTGGNGYSPGVVTATQSGVYTVRLRYPEPFALGFVSALLNSDPWTRANDQPQGGQFPTRHQRVALAWDVTITQGGAGDAGGTPVTGRLYSKEYISILDGNDGANGPRSTSPTFFILTRAGYLYQVNFSDTDPWGFPIYSNSFGLVTGDFVPTYMSGTIGADVFDQANGGSSYVRSPSPDTWVEGTTYLYEPQAADIGPISNNKIFFNTPDPNLPTSALVTDTDTERNNTHTTWLLNEIPALNNVEPFTFKGILPANGSCQGDLVAEEGEGGNFVFDSELEGQAVLQIDLNNNGTYTDPVDVTINKNVRFGLDSIFWNGTDGTGAVIPANPNFNFNYILTVRGGEIHLLLEDIENNNGGVTFSRLNGPGSPANSFNYDHSGIGGATSGGGAPGNPQPTTVPFTYSDGFGNEKLLDQWAFIETSNFGTGTLAINIQQECSPGDHDNDGIPDIVDIDDDNDGVPDLLEYCHPTEGFACLPNGLDPSGDADGDGVQNFEDANDAAVGNSCTDSNNDGICDQIAAIYDTDGDNVPDHFDLDSDNDGISDLVEAGHNQPDADGNGVIDGDNSVFGANGFYVNLETNDAQTAVANYVPWDFDGDGIPDHDDLDSDNDGILDVVEAGYANSDSNQDGRIDDGNGNVPAVNGDGLVPLINPAITGVGIPLPIDWDNDGIPDWHDLDSDNDGILDVIEGGYQGNDTNGDGRIDDGNGNVPSVNSDGLPPVMQNGPITLPPDTDNDGIRDWHDLDSDNDGINDTVENRNPDGDADGFIGTGPITVDANGVAIADANGPITPFAPLVNTDGEGPGDFRDLDADGDGINDVIEGGLADPDGDGLIGTGTPAVNPFGQATGVTSNPTDTDNNGVPDFQQLPPVDESCEAPAVPTLSSSATQVCEGEAVTFTATGVPAAADITYIWTNGTSEFTTTAPTFTLNPTVVSNTGTYTVSAVRDTCNSGASNAISLTVSPRPASPVIIASATSVCEGEAVTLSTNVVENPAITYQWTLTNASGSQLVANSTSPNLVLDPISASQAGTYSVVATGGGGACPSAPSAGVAIAVGSASTPPVITASTTSVCEGEAVTLTSNGPVDDTYQWTLTTADGNSQVVPNATGSSLVLDPIAASQAGTYTIEALNSDCPSGPSAGVSIAVTPKPVTPTMTVDKAVHCEGERLVFMTPRVEGTDVLYEFTFTNVDGRTDPLVTTSQPSAVIEQLVAANTGMYQVRTIVNGCPSDFSEGVAVDVSAGGLPNVTASSSAPVNNPACEGDDVTLSVTPVDGATYEWSGPNGVVGTTADVVLENAAAAASGQYSVTVTVGECPKTLDPVIVQVDPKPATPTLSVDNAAVCPGESFTLSTDAVAGDNVTYDWLLNGTVVTSTTEPTLLIATPTDADAGSYTVVARDGGCPSDPSNAVDVAIQPPLAGDITSDPAGGVCEGESITLTAPSADGATYAWTGPNGFTSADAAITLDNVTPANNGDYSVVVTVNGCPNNFGPTTLEINTKPATPTISTDKDSACPGEAVTLSTAAATGDAITYDWLLNGTVVATTDVPTLEISDFQATNAGDYTVVVKDGSCPSDPSDPAASVALKEGLEGVSASSNSPVCIGDPINLTATDVEGATYAWTGPNGYTSSEQNPTIENATEANAGDYTVVVTVDGCPATIPPTTVEVTPKPAAPVVTVAEENVCEGTTGVLNVTSPDPIPEGMTFTALDAVGATVGTSTTGVIEIATDSLEGIQFYSVISQLDGGCPSEPSEAVAINVVPKPTEEAAIATAPDGGDPCGMAPMSLEGNASTEGTGTWTSSNADVVFVDPNSPTTDVMGLEDGDVVTWTFANEACGEYSSASITIIAMPPMTTANDDAFTILNSESITGQSITGNDTPNGGGVTVISGPSNGTGTIDANGNLTYTPAAGFIGTDQIVYELCDLECPAAPCDQATVTITVNQDPSDLDCTVADVISPNGDGLNDRLIIPCSDFKNVGLKIFNRWGDLVFEADNYNNDWDGTHDGADLPPGPYYYIFEENGVEPTTGCVSIAR